MLCGVLSAALDINRVLLDHWVSVKTCKKKKKKSHLKGFSGINLNSNPRQILQEIVYLAIADI